ncbi:tRNA (N6-isopentenyl adenosine(37)-C2)-methylthiotransferase MiaB [bacterium]|nr:tRNA (N6-isopentenyl adenosine(37)-C2)-methylthiotransferase MiaB [candidate division CSSED10-310 bacterium]
MGDDRSFYIENFGCQMNVHDSEQLAVLLKHDGWIPVMEPDGAAVIILNTCSVREKAEQKVFSRLGRLRELRNGRSPVRFVIAGCMARAWGRKLLKRLPFVDLVVGPGMLSQIPTYLRKLDGGSRPIVDIRDPESVFCVPSNWIENPGIHSAWVTIMEGCDNFCSYCIVPYVRGRERFRDSEQIIEEIGALVAHGVREVTLLGQNVNSYRSRNAGFPELLRQIQAIDGLVRIRFTTSHPKDMSDELIQTVAECSKLCEYMHFPVQSGSSRILARMNRGYTREEYLGRVDRMKALIPDVALSSDFIVGFPGETEEDHRESVSLLEAVAYDNIFIFNYSVRTGTRAAEFPDTVPPDVKVRRLEDLLQRQRRIAMDRNQALIGETVDVLVDGSAKRGNGMWTGRTRQNRVVNFSGQARPGTLVPVRIESASPNCLYGSGSG